ncbi:hypothetical protein [Prosthecobacter debontii]|nr:hypothetical protein [Prosthecobacter debontii]
MSMTVLVFLRSSFGYAFLRPKSIFLAGSWAFILFSIYAWNEPAVWRTNKGLCLFGCTSATLYMFHLISVYVTEVRDTATHDNDSGTPHILRLLSWLKTETTSELRNLVVMVVEPALVLSAALILRLGGQAVNNLSSWLIYTAFAMFLKEGINYWLQIRQRKRYRDAMNDAEEGFGSGNTSQADLPAPIRKAKVKRQRVW